MLVDSGADFSVIPFTVGEELGFKMSEEERTLPAIGLGGKVDFVLRESTLEINKYSFNAPVCWVQNSNINDIILGRETVFDKFNIQFRQADEQIIFE